jgi:hypothetical protein
MEGRRGFLDCIRTTARDNDVVVVIDACNLLCSLETGALISKNDCHFGKVAELAGDE